MVVGNEEEGRAGGVDMGFDDACLLPTYVSVSACAAPTAPARPRQASAASTACTSHHQPAPDHDHARPRRSPGPSPAHRAQRPQRPLTSRRRCTRPSRRSRRSSPPGCSRTSPFSSSARPLRSRSTSPRQPASIRRIYMSRADAPHRLPKATLPVREAAVASLASVLGGFGVVALFCSVGVYV